MITQELLSYIRGEIAKGRTREDIHQTLVSGGGWTEADITEAFKVVIPFQGAQGMGGTAMSKPAGTITPAPDISSIQPSSASSVSFSPASSRLSQPQSTYTPSPTLMKQTPAVKSTVISSTTTPSHAVSSFLKFLVIVIVIGGLGFGGWYYRSQLKGLLNSISGSLTSSSNTAKNATPVKKITATTTTPVAQTLAPVKDCGTTTAPNPANSSTYTNNTVLSCLGASAVGCENAKAILKDNTFPTMFEITKTQNSCNFKISYPADNTLTDATGKKLALQYISCPVDIVKATNNPTSANPQFVAPNKTDLGKYASQIYFYGTLGLFVENNLDKTKILGLGCSGEYIDSIIASYNLKSVN